MSTLTQCLLSFVTLAVLTIGTGNAAVVTSFESEAATRADVDMVELNHFLDDHGREVFRQVVFYDWSDKNRQLEVRAWRLIKHPSQLPRKKHRGDGYIVRWQDKFILREVHARTMRETFSQEDPERVNRAVLPENERRPLWSSSDD